MKGKDTKLLGQQNYKKPKKHISQVWYLDITRQMVEGKLSLAQRNFVWRTLHLGYEVDCMCNL